MKKIIPSIFGPQRPWDLIKTIRIPFPIRPALFRQGRGKFWIDARHKIGHRYLAAAFQSVNYRRNIIDRFVLTELELRIHPLGNEFEKANVRDEPPVSLTLFQSPAARALEQRDHLLEQAPGFFSGIDERQPAPAVHRTEIPGRQVDVGSIPFGGDVRVGTAEYDVCRSLVRQLGLGIGPRHVTVEFAVGEPANRQMAGLDLTFLRRNQRRKRMVVHKFLDFRPVFSLEMIWNKHRISFWDFIFFRW